ncbi:uncharacterized protein LOC131028693 [Cryptomeria japonica]|uniref:uncharacterized protein LOC131028693 n=1 Tax=Cryptomeria japonica TaxID=3369 RepID=UPI0027DA980C|nr:uncharacterized protein LOC131028693 [Cryptomeria japonica]
MAAPVSEWPPAAGEWPSHVEEILQMAKRAVSDVGVSMRVPEALVNAKAEALVNSKAEAYIPQMVSLGPYHHLWSKDKSLQPFHQRPTHLSQLELYKLKKATETDPEIINCLFTKISEASTIFAFEPIYHMKIEEKDIPEFTWMMVIDALFLSNSLSAFIGHIGKESILCDIVKLENQIPLSLLTQLEDASIIMSQIGNLCRTCFQVGNPNIKIEKEKHLLDYMHKYISSILQLQPEIAEEERTWQQWVLSGIDTMVAGVLGAIIQHPAKSVRQDFLDKYNAEELRKGGIKFRPSKESGKNGFCKTSDTLYLSPIRISEPYSEVVLRNLLALEFNDYASQQKNVSQYVELMDCLIDTPEDVALLRKCHVIDRQSMMITDDYVARTWDGMSKPVCLTGFLDTPGGLKAKIKEALIKNYYKSKIRGWWDELRTDYLSSPWKLAALVVGVFVTVLTMVQTYCTVKDCQPEHNARGRGGHDRFSRFG